MNKILFIDTVTTGMNPEKCAIYRIGGIYTIDGVEQKRFELRMRPFANARISEQSLWISGESRSSLLIYPDEKAAFARFVEFLNDIVDIKNPKDKIYLAGFNSTAFDVPFLREWFRRNGNERFRDYFYVQTIDTMCLATVMLIKTRHNMPDFHLETAARFMHVKAVATQSYDCLTNAKTSLEIYRAFEKRCGLGECLDNTEATEVKTNYSEKK